MRPCMQGGSADDVTIRGRKLPQATLRTLLRGRAAAAAAAAEPVHQMLLRSFGRDASATSRRALGIPEAATSLYGRLCGFLSSVFGMFFGTTAPQAPPDPGADAPATTHTAVRRLHHPLPAANVDPLPPAWSEQFAV